MTAPAENQDLALQATGQFREWLIRLDLLSVWEATTALPTNRSDAYRKELIRLYATERRKAERSQRFRLERTP